MGIFILWLILSVIVGSIGSSRRIGFFGGLIASLILSPIIGFFIVIASQRKSDIEFQKKLLQNSMTPKKDHLEEIDRLLQLKSNGVISDEEYLRMKQKVIDSI